jgi:autotransporter passenger strand-loop-strand repeat protein
VTYDSLSVAKNAELSVRKGGIVEQTVIHSGGTLVISSGGAGGNTILAGGHEIVSDGGHITGTQIFRKGASLTVQSLKPQTLVISGFGTTNAIDFTTLSYGPGESLSASYDAGKKQTTLTIADTTGDAKIVLFGQYAAAGFELKSDGGTGSLLTYSMPISASHQDLTVPHR